MRFLVGLLLAIGMTMGGMTMTLAEAQSFRLSSPTLSEGGRVPMAHVYNGFDYSGANRAPALVWSHAPAGTESFAVTVFDPDAPKPGGWWHWLVIDLPKTTSSLPEGAGPGRGLPAGALQIVNDFGTADYGGPAPPAGKAHRYVFTVYALKTAALGVSAHDAPARVRKAIESASLAKAAITAIFGK